MQRFTELGKMEYGAGSAVALGYFDGVHLGHRAVLSEAVSCARSRGLTAAAFTFSLPVSGGFKGRRILTGEEKRRRIASLGVELYLDVYKRQVVTVTVDTRVSDVNLDKFNEKYTDLASTKNVENRRKPTPAGNKQKFGNKKNRNQPFQKKRETEAERLQRIQLEKARKAQLKVSIPDEIAVGELATRLKVNVAQVIKKLMGLGVMASISEVIDFDTASLVAEELGAKVEHEVHVTIEELSLIHISADGAGICK